MAPGAGRVSPVRRPAQHLSVRRGGQYRKPHPCGHYGHPRLACRCTDAVRNRLVGTLDESSRAARQAEAEARLKAQLEGIGVDVPPKATEDLVNALGRGGQVGVAVALVLIIAIAESTYVTKTETGKTTNAKTPVRHATTIKRLAVAALPQTAAGPSPVLPMLDAMASAPGSLPLTRTELATAPKVPGPKLTEQMLVVVTKASDTSLAKIAARIEAVKQELATRRGTLAGLKERLQKLPR